MRCMSLMMVVCLGACGDKATEDTHGHEHGSEHTTGEDTSADPDPDSGSPGDDGSPDSGTTDGGPPDTSSPDTAGPDTATPDTGDIDTGTEPPLLSDLDGDGFSVEEGDCNDLDSSLHPAREEVCDGIDNNCDGAVDEGVIPTWYFDFDGDGHGSDTLIYEGCDPLEGYIASSDDCDDSRDTVAPGALEVCDGLDNDCDDDTDEDVTTTFFLDGDDDGYGDAGFTIAACEPPDSYTDNALDCNDTDASVHPAGTEACDGVDNDCDGEIDEDSATDALTYYRDADADGFGTITDPASACAVPTGFVDNAHDCDDHDNDIHPDAAEHCDEEDNNCDGSIDEAGSIGETTWYADADGDGYGSALAPTAACEPPPGHLVDATDCHDDDALIHPAAIEECDGHDNDCDGGTDEAGAVGETTWYADDDGDGFGLDESAMTGCVAPAGSILVGGDCDDGRVAVWPGAPEFCNEADDDCDGETDEASALDAPTWYTDADGDGYGDGDSPVVSCSAAAGTVSNPDDCDDTLASVFPGAPEVVSDGIDQDCDGEDLVTPLHTGSEPGWYHANYDGVIAPYDDTVGYNGSVSCPTTCAAFGLSAQGMRFVCNLQYGGVGSSGEGCHPGNEGLYGEDNCGLMVRDMVSTTENGNTEDCAGGTTMSCVTGSCSEGVTWHSIECQCS
jgi:hypothetical protein